MGVKTSVHGSLAVGKARSCWKCVSLWPRKPVQLDGPARSDIYKSAAPKARPIGRPSGAEKLQICCPESTSNWMAQRSRKVKNLLPRKHVHLDGPAPPGNYKSVDRKALPFGWYRAPLELPICCTERRSISLPHRKLNAPH